MKHPWLTLLALLVACGSGSDDAIFQPSGDGSGGAGRTGSGGAVGTGGSTATAGMDGTSGSGGDVGGTGGDSTGAGGDLGTGGSVEEAGVAGSAGGGGGPVRSDSGVPVVDASPGRDASGSTCGGQGFPTFDDACNGTQNCSIGLHRVDCCGTTIAIGINHAFRDEFDMAEAKWRTTLCPAVCDCQPAPTMAENGTSGSPDNARVVCDSKGPGPGNCQTYF
jgi:hypothetical protein